ncbi:hypothetical protein STEG23_016160 [Scotinomys teguina]
MSSGAAQTQVLKLTPAMEVTGHAHNQDSKQKPVYLNDDRHTEDVKVHVLTDPRPHRSKFKVVSAGGDTSELMSILRNNWTERFRMVTIATDERSRTLPEGQKPQKSHSLVPGLSDGSSSLLHYALPPMMQQNSEILTQLHDSSPQVVDIPQLQLYYVPGQFRKAGTIPNLHREEEKEGIGVSMQKSYLYFHSLQPSSQQLEHGSNLNLRR